MKEKNIITGKIIEAKADASESKDHIVTGYLKIEYHNMVFKGFVPDWRSYFPYTEKSGYSLKYGLGDELLNNLNGKKIKFTLRFCDYPNETKILLTKDIGISLPNYADLTNLSGKIIKIEQNKEFPQNEVYYLDCGFYIFKISAEKGKFIEGNYIQIGGRLDIFIEKIY